MKACKTLLLMHFMYCPILFSRSLLRQRELHYLSNVVKEAVGQMHTHVHTCTHEARQACAQMVDVSSSEVCRLERCLTELRCQKPDSAAMLTWSLLLTHNNSL